MTTVEQKVASREAVELRKAKSYEEALSLLHLPPEVVSHYAGVFRQIQEETRQNESCQLIYSRETFQGVMMSLGVDEVRLSLVRSGFVVEEQGRMPITVYSPLSLPSEKMRPEKLKPDQEVFVLASRESATYLEIKNLVNPKGSLIKRLIISGGKQP